MMLSSPFYSVSEATLLLALVGVLLLGLGFAAFQRFSDITPSTDGTKDVVAQAKA
jgi:hypothetical protein